MNKVCRNIPGKILPEIKSEIQMEVAVGSLEKRSEVEKRQAEELQ